MFFQPCLKADDDETFGNPNSDYLKSDRCERYLTHTHVYEVALGGSVHETGIRWDVHTFPLVGHTQNL